MVDETLQPHCGLLFLISRKRCCIGPTHWTEHTTGFDSPVVDLDLLVHRWPEIFALQDRTISMVSFSGLFPLQPVLCEWSIKDNGMFYCVFESAQKYFVWSLLPDHK